MEVHLAGAETELSKLAEVLLQLRPQYSKDSLVKQIRKQQNSGYQLAYVKSGNEILCVAGFVVSEKIAWGKHIYIDDLVTNKNCRSTGVGTFIINWFKSYCKELGCKTLHLDSGVQKFPAHRFYIKNRFNIASHHFSITDICS